MFRAVLLMSLVILTVDSSETHYHHRQRRIVGGQAASPPPPGASEAENVVENPILVPVQPVRPPPTTSTYRPAFYGDNAPIVFLRRGRREANIKGEKEPDGVYAFKGIRYAEPPIGLFRFQRPRRAKLQGDVDATKFPPPCPQTIGQRLVGSEDCLFLNIFSPEIPSNSSRNSKKHPVIFWIHGGGYRRGSGSQYGVSDLVKKGLVVVTIQYRLGSLGFLSTNRKELSGNAGLYDITSSMHWVRRYIEFFGGDPNRIVPSGQGSGASAAVMLTLTHFTQHWIRGVFAMSGSAISAFAVDEKPAETAEEVSAIDKCHSINDSLAFVRCMQKLPLDSIVQGDNKVQEGRLRQQNNADNYITSISKLLNPGPAVEGEDDFRFLPNFLTDTPLDILQKGDFAKVPLLTGVTKDETSTSAKGGGIASRLLGGVEATEQLIETLIQKLLNVNSGIFGGIGGKALSPVVNQLFSNTKYLKGITSSLNKAASALDKIIEMTTDALFNLPAFLTSQLWSKKNKAYLYSFEHKPRNSAADDFLQENPLTQQEAPVEGVGHGDDLQYLFDVRSLEGQTVQTSQLSDSQDLQVRDYFTTLVAEFAHSGEPKVGEQRMVPFSSNNGDYLIIDQSPKLARGFRKCQMGLWAGLGDVLKSAECSFLQLGELVNGLGVGGLVDVTRGATGALTHPAQDVASGLKNTTHDLATGLGGLLGGHKDGGSTRKPLLGLG